MFSKFVLFAIALYLTSTWAISVHRYKNRMIPMSPRFARIEKRSCEHGLCEHVESYPEEEIVNLLSKSKTIHSYFGNIIAPNIEHRSRNNFENDFEPMCRSNYVTKMPREAKDINGISRMIVNVGNATQYVIYETCENEDAFCSERPDYGVDPRCRQMYNIVKLITAQNNKLVYENFKVPSACVCTYD